MGIVSSDSGKNSDKTFVLKRHIEERTSGVVLHRRPELERDYSGTSQAFCPRLLPRWDGKKPTAVLGASSLLGIKSVHKEAGSPVVCQGVKGNKDTYERSVSSGYIQPQLSSIDCSGGAKAACEQQNYKSE